jgi:hypothetical protein
MKMQIELDQGKTFADWIPRSCAKPEDGEKVLATTEHLLGFDKISVEVTTAVYDAYRDCFKKIDNAMSEDDSRYLRVTAWAKLPEEFRSELITVGVCDGED